jgi:hypothetical protein
MASDQTMPSRFLMPHRSDCSLATAVHAEPVLSLLVTEQNLSAPAIFATSLLRFIFSGSISTVRTPPASESRNFTIDRPSERQIVALGATLQAHERLTLVDVAETLPFTTHARAMR